jgi:hypothetical protein
MLASGKFAPTTKMTRFHNPANSLDRACVHAAVRKVETSCVPQHVRMDWKSQCRFFSCPGHYFAHRCHRDRSAALSNK